MRPRGRGDDADDEDDEYEDTTPLRSTPEAESSPAPAPAPDPDPVPAPAPSQPARPPLSSLVVKPPPQENGGSSPPSAARVVRSSSPDHGNISRGSPPLRRRRDFSPPGPRGWERRRSPPPPERRRPGSPPPLRRRFSPPRFQPRHPRIYDEPQGYGPHSGPSQPRLRRQETSTFDDFGPRYNRGFQGGGRGGARIREGSPLHGRGGRSYGRGGYSGPGKDFINIDGEYVHRNDPNLSPREGDWICQNPNCGNLNFARRTHCNNCNKYRYATEEYEPSRSPRRSYFSSPPRGPLRTAGPPINRAPPREMTRYKSPPQGWGVDDPRGYPARTPPGRPGRFAEPSFKERMGFRGERDPRDRMKFEWSGSDDHSQRDRDGLYLDRDRRRSGSPHGNWGNGLRERSRSPNRNRPVKSSFSGRGQSDDYADPYVSRGRPSNMDSGRGRGCGRGRGYRPGSSPYHDEGRGDLRGARARNEDGY